MKLSALSRKKELRVVGIMNGTSLDGIDYVYTKVQNGSSQKIQYIDRKFFPFPEKIRNQLIKAVNHQLKVDELSDLHHDLGRLYRDQYKKILKQKKWKADAIGLHGQTVHHNPPVATLQIGEPSYLSAEFKVPVVSDFRAADLAAGGQGAPIASFFHQVVFQTRFPKKVISVHNLGGISNLSLIDQKGDVQKAFDTGPANMLMDLFISRVSNGEIQFDQDGQFARRGLPAQNVVDEVLRENPYFQSKPPKTCGAEQFGEIFLNQLERRLGPMIPEDKMATLAELTARSIAEAYRKFSKSQPVAVIFCGGGALNSYLHRRIQYHMPQSEILTTENFGWPVKSIEGAAFALLAALRIWQEPANLPKTTGARSSVQLGKITEAF